MKLSLLLCCLIAAPLVAQSDAPELSAYAYAALNAEARSASLRYPLHCDAPESCSGPQLAAAPAPSVAALRALVVDAHPLRLAEEGELLRITSGAPRSELLAVRIDHLAFHADTPWAALAQLLKHPSVRAAALRLRLDFSLRAARVFDPDQFPAALPLEAAYDNLSVAELLDRIVLHFPGLWSYGELARPDGSTLLSLDVDPFPADSGAQLLAKRYPCTDECKSRGAACAYEQGRVLLMSAHSLCLQPAHDKLSAPDAFARQRLGLGAWRRALEAPAGLPVEPSRLRLQLAAAYASLSRAEFAAYHPLRAHEASAEARRLYALVEAAPSAPELAPLAILGLARSGFAPDAMRRLSAMPNDMPGLHYLYGELYFALGDPVASAREYELWLAARCPSPAYAQAYDAFAQRQGRPIAACSALPEALRTRLELLQKQTRLLAHLPKPPAPKPKPRVDIPVDLGEAAY